MYVLAIANIISFQMMNAGSRFGETFGATALGSALGSTVGTALGNAMSNPRPTPVVREVVVNEIRVAPARRVRQLEKEERCLRADLCDLRSRKQSLERRIASLEQELNEIEAAIDIKSQTLRNVENKRQEIFPVTPKREIAEFEV